MKQVWYFLALCAFMLGSPVFAGEANCPQGQTMDLELGICVDTPVMNEQLEEDGQNSD